MSLRRHLVDNAFLLGLLGLVALMLIGAAGVDVSGDWWWAVLLVPGPVVVVVITVFAMVDRPIRYCDVKGCENASNPYHSHATRSPS